jgi:hypothetical protein
MPLDNEFDSIAEEAFGAAPSKEPSPAQPVQESMFQASFKQPDRHAEVVKLADRLKMPTSVVDANFDSIKKDSELDRDFDQLVDKTPGLAAYLKDPDRASVSQDDLDNLSEYEKTFKEHSLFTTAVRSLNSGLAGLNAGIARIPALGYAAFTLPQNLVAKASGDKSWEAKTPDWLLNNPVATFFDQQQKDNAVPELSADILDEIGKGSYSRASRSLMAQVIQSAPTSIVAALATGGLGAAGGLAAAGAVSGAGTLKEGVDAGADPAAATTNALISGTFEGAFESLSNIGILKAWEKQIAKQYGKQVSKKVVSQIAGELAQTFGYAAVTEGLEEFGTSVAQDYTAYSTGVNPNALEGFVGRAANSGLVGAASGATTSSLTAYSMARHRAAQAHLAKQNQNFYLQLGDRAVQMKTADRVPGYQSNFIDQATQGTKISIPVEAFETYFQKKGLDPAQVAQEIGITKQLDDAKESGSDIEVPLGQWTEKLAKTEHYKGLADDVRLSSDAPSVNEVRAEDKELQSAIEKVDAEAQQEESPVAKGIKFITDDIAAQFQAQGLKKTRAEAEFAARGIAVLAARNGKDPIEFYQAQNIRIGRGESGQATAQVYNQEDSFVKGDEVDQSDFPLPETVKVTTRDDHKTFEPTSKQEVTAALREAARRGKYVNAHTGNEINLSSEVISKSSSQAIQKLGVGRSRLNNHVQAMQYMPELIENAVLLTKASNRKGGQGEFEYYFAPLSMNGETYDVKLQVRNSKGERVLYNYAVVKSGGVGPENPSGATGTLGHPAELSMKDFGDSVKKSRETSTFFQSGSDEPVSKRSSLLLESQFGKEIANAVQSETQAQEILGAQSEEQARGILERGRAGQGTLGSTFPESASRLEGLPKSSQGPVPGVKELARRYVEQVGLPYREHQAFVRADPERGARIAQAFSEMKHDPENPEVKQAYRAMIDETLQQFKLIDSTGLKLEMIKPDMENPYPNGSNDVFKDIQNGHLWFFPTDLGFGTQTTISENPLLEKTGIFIDGHELAANDVFRIVHDYFGHAKEGNGFGKDGEENAWQAHVRMYSPEAARAMTTETRGQNSWVNFGPKGKENQANPKETTYADQKVGLLPEWIMNEGLAPDRNKFEQRYIETPLGQIRIGEGGINIDLFVKANTSTFIHETGHLYLELLTRLAGEEGATEQTKADLKELRDWMGLKDGEAIGVEQHEMFARGFEKYIGEGKAPTKALQKAFNKFKYWILSVYKNLAGLNVELTPEVRSVMDRMLATDEEIRSAEVDMAREPLFAEPTVFGMNEKQAKRYIEARDEARNASEQKLLARLMKDETKKRTKDYEAKRDAIRAEVEREVSTSKTYQTIDILKSNQKFKFDRKSLSKEEAARMPRGVFSGDAGFDASVLAEAFGYSSGQELIETLTRAPKKEDLIRQMTDERMNEVYPDIFRDRASVHTSAIEALHNDSEEKLLRMELEHLASNDMPTLKDAIRRVARRVPTQKEVRAQARSIIGSKVTADIKPHLYQRAEVKAAKEAGVLLAKGDIDGAFEAKRKELLNHELYRAAVEAQEFLENSSDLHEKILRRKDEDLAKTRDIDVVNAARAVLAAFGLAEDPAKTPGEYLEQLKNYDVPGQPERYSMVASLVNEALESASEFEQSSFDAFVKMHEAVEALWSLSKEIKTNDVQGRKVTREQILDEMQATVDEFIKTPSKKEQFSRSATKWEGASKMLMGVSANFVRVEHWVNALDVVGLGPFKEYLWRPIQEAVTSYKIERVKVAQELTKIITDWGRGLKIEPIMAPELASSEYPAGHQFSSKTQLLMAILHTGNESNKSKLLRGYGWGQIGPDGNLDTSKWDAFISRMHQEGVLTQKDYDTAQAIWDLNESLKPGAQRAFKKMFGYFFSEISAERFETPFGSYKGGYIPAKVDPDFNATAEQRAAREAFEQDNNGFMFPTTGKGFTKSREDRFAAPLLLDLGALPMHVDSVLRFSHLEPAVKQVAGIVTSPRFGEMMKAVNSGAVQEILIPWLQRTATQRVMNTPKGALGKAVAKFASFAKRRVVMQIMFANLANAAQQPTGIIMAGAKIKPKYLLQSLALGIANWKQQNDSMLEASSFMRVEQDQSAHETMETIREIQTDPTVFSNIQAFSVKHTYFLQAAFQNFTNKIVWNAAYNQAFTETADHKESILRADEAVRLTQGSNSPESTSAILSGDVGNNLFMYFAGYFNNVASLNAFEMQRIVREDMGLKPTAAKLFAVYFFGFAMPAFLSAAISKGLAGSKWDDDEDGEYLDDILSMFFTSQAGTLAGMVPVVGTVAANIANKFNKNIYDDRLTLSPLFSALDQMTGAAVAGVNLIKDEQINEVKAAKDALTTIGLVTKLPVGALGRPVGYLMRTDTEFTEEPVEFTRGLATGRESSK